MRFATYDRHPMTACGPTSQNLEDLPKPHKEGLVKLKQQPERFFASVSFSGASFGIGF